MTRAAQSAPAQGMAARTLASHQAQIPVQSPSRTCRWGSPPVLALGGAFLERFLMPAENQQKGLRMGWFWSPPSIGWLACPNTPHFEKKKKVMCPQHSGGHGCGQAPRTAALTRSYLLGPRPQRLRPHPGRLGQSGICREARGVSLGVEGWRAGRRLRLPPFPSPHIAFQSLLPLCQRREAEADSHGPGSGHAGTARAWRRSGSLPVPPALARPGRAAQPVAMSREMAVGTRDWERKVSEV